MKIHPLPRSGTLSKRRRRASNGLRAFSCLFVAIALGISAPAQMLIKNAKLSGASNQVTASSTLTVLSTGQFTVASGGGFTLASGSTVTFGTPLSLANGGTGVALSDPGADRLTFWDDSAGAIAFLTVGTGLTLTDTTLAADTTAIAPTDATYITQVAEADLSAEQALASLSTGIMRVATTTGVVTSLTDSAGIAANISDETGTGVLVFGTSPDFTTGITIGSVAVPTISSTSTLTNKTLSLTSNTLTATSAELITAVSDESGSGVLLFGTSPTITTPTISGAIAFPDGVLQTFNPDATVAGLNVGSIAGDPSAPTDGDLWYDSTAEELTARINGATVALGAGGGGGDITTDAAWAAAGDLIVATGNNTAAVLSIGTSTYVLTSNGTTATWAAPSGGSGTATLARWTALDNQPPASNYATFDTRNSIAVLDFDATTDESAVFVNIAPEGADFSAGAYVIIKWMGTSATSGAAMWEASIERMNTDEDSDSFDSVLFASGTANGTSGIITSTSISLAAGDCDGLTAGEPFRLKISRDANGTNGTDDMTGDAELVAVELQQQ